MVFGTAGSPLVLSWTYVVCSSDQYAIVSGNDTIACAPCPEGGSCAAAAAAAAGVTADVDLPASLSSGVVVQQTILAQPGYWASADVTDTKFYTCPVAQACIGGKRWRAVGDVVACCCYRAPPCLCCVVARVGCAGWMCLLKIM